MKKERNQAVSASVAVSNAIDWDKIDLQKVIQASNQGRLGGPLTKWLADQSWNLGKFVVKDNFVIDISKKARVKISYLGDNFRNWLINTIEDLPPLIKLEVFVLPKAMYDKDIIVRLGGVAKAITSMGEVFHLMELQPEGPESAAGQLFTDGKANIFYVPQPVTRLDDKKFSYVNLAGETKVEELEDSQYLFEVTGQWFVLRAVNICWCCDGWYVRADSVEDMEDWSDGCQVFSDNSALVTSEPLAPAA